MSVQEQAAVVPTSQATDGPRPWQCPKSPTGIHELIQYCLVGQRDDRRFPSGTSLWVQCRHCYVMAPAFLEDHCIQWRKSEASRDDACRD